MFVRVISFIFFILLFSSVASAEQNFNSEFVKQNSRFNNEFNSNSVAVPSATNPQRGNNAVMPAPQPINRNSQPRFYTPRTRVSSPIETPSPENDDSNAFNNLQLDIDFGVGAFNTEALKEQAVINFKTVLGWRFFGFGNSLPSVYLFFEPFINTAFFDRTALLMSFGVGISQLYDSWLYTAFEFGAIIPSVYDSNGCSYYDRDHQNYNGGFSIRYNDNSDNDCDVNRDVLVDKDNSVILRDSSLGMLKAGLNFRVYISSRFFIKTNVDYIFPMKNSYEKYLGKGISYDLGIGFTLL